MTMLDLILKKKAGESLSTGEIEAFVQGVTTGSVPDYQTAALLMAICFQGMNEEETFALTEAMRTSGTQLDLSDLPMTVDKHSTGGVGDKTTLVIAPLVAACGVPVAKMSGRGLGFTGGTIDKLSAIPGFTTTLSPENFKAQVREKGLAIAGQSEDLAKADKILYALRDVTGTVDNQSLIAASIMSKKLAAGSGAILLDVKCGQGAFMHTRTEAEELAKAMVKIGTRAGRKTCAMITSMEQPLGAAVGNSAEVMEAIHTLRGNGPKDLTELSLSLAAHMLLLGGKAADMADAKRKVQIALDSGAGLASFGAMVSAQGGDPKVIEDVSLLPRPAYGEEILAAEDGYVTALDALTIGQASQKTGAGRMQKEDDIDLSAGVFLFRKVGEKVARGERIARVFGNDNDKVQEAAKLVQSAYTFGVVPPEETPLEIAFIEPSQS